MPATDVRANRVAEPREPPASSPAAERTVREDCVCVRSPNRRLETARARHRCVTCLRGRHRYNSCDDERAGGRRAQSSARTLEYDAGLSNHRRERCTTGVTFILHLLVESCRDKSDVESAYHRQVFLSILAALLRCPSFFLSSASPSFRFLRCSRTSNDRPAKPNRPEVTTE